MLKVGLTGGVACGKTTVGEMFVSLGARLILADRIAHQLMQPGLPVYKQVVKAFGQQILNPDGTINRPKLADAVFPSGRIAELNAIVHPAVIAEQEAWIERQFHADPNAVAIVEAALLLEAGTWKRFDRMIAVTCTSEQKVERFAKRHGMSLDAARTEVERRQITQASDEAKVKISHYVVDNAGTLEETRGQVERIWAQLRKANHEPKA